MSIQFCKVLAVAMLSCLLVGVAGIGEAQAQEGLPGADQLESEDGDSQDESPFESNNAGEADDSEKNQSSEEGGSSDEGTTADKDESAENKGADAESGDDKGEAAGEGEADGKQADGEQPAGPARKSDDAKNKEASMESPAGKDGEAADKSAEAKQAEEGEESDEDAKRGEIVETTSNTETEYEGQGDVDGDIRWVQSGLNAHGVPGLQHIGSAQARKANTYHVGFFGEVMGGRNIIRAEDSNTFAAGRMMVHAQPIKYFSANLTLGARNNVNSFGRPQAMLSQGDLSLGLRGHYSPLEYLHLAGDLTIDEPTGFGSAGLNFSGTTVRPRALATLEVNPLIEDVTVPLTAHLNLGYRVDNTANTVADGIELTRVERFAYDISEYDAVELGIGAEYDLPYVKPFFSWNFDVPVNGPDGYCAESGALDCPQQAGFKSFPNNLSLGLRGEPVEQLSLHAGVDLGLTATDAAGIPVNPPYKVFLGASWNIDPRANVEKTTTTIEKTRMVKELPPQGRIIGEVRDKETDLPVGGAKIAYPTTDHSPQMAGDESGMFRSYGFTPEETVTVEISHPDYETKEMEVTVEKGEQTVQIPLEPAVREGTVSGKVTDASGSGIEAATVVFDGPTTKEATTDESGEFSIDIDAGSYSVGASAPEFKASKQSLEVASGEKNSIEFGLEEGIDPSLAEITDGKIEIEARVSFDTGTAEIDSGSHDVLDAVASRLIARPDIDRVEVQGHTDDVGSKEDNKKLSEERAKAVVDYLVSEGVAEDRLVGEGYGPEEPLVPNISDRNRRMNRRVEFKIMER